MRPTRIFATLSLVALSACAGAPGDFCAVVAGPLDFAPATAAAIVVTDRPAAEAISVQNAHGRANCPDWRR